MQKDGGKEWRRMEERGRKGDEQKELRCVINVHQLHMMSVFVMHHKYVIIK